MNSALVILEGAVILAGLGLLLLDLWTPAEQKRQLGYAAAAAVGLILAGTFLFHSPFTQAEFAFEKMYVLDGLALFFKRFFLLAAVAVLLMSVEYADRIQAGVAEFYALTLFALAGMMFTASANDLILAFVALELITVTFYVLNSFQRNRLASLEAGVKYLILGALASGFMVYGIALIFGAADTTNFGELLAKTQGGAVQPTLHLGFLLLLVGIGFKIAAFPIQIWVPDVYQGAPTPAVAFLAVGSKAAGFALLLRVLFSAFPAVTANSTKLLMCISAVTILYGNLCAIPQRNLKRLLGYSSIAHAGYLLLGIAAMNAAGSSAVLYYLSGYLFTVLAAFSVICLVMRGVEGEDIAELSGLHRRSPLLASGLSLAMISLAGIPPLAGFFGKFLLIKAVLEKGADQPGYYWLIAVALIGVVISFYYYLGVVRAVYWGGSNESLPSIHVSKPIRWTLCACMAGMLYLGLFPNSLVNFAVEAVKVLNL